MPRRPPPLPPGPRPHRGCAFGPAPPSSGRPPRAWHRLGRSSGTMTTEHLSLHHPVAATEQKRVSCPSKTPTWSAAPSGSRASATMSSTTSSSGPSVWPTTEGRPSGSACRRWPRSPTGVPRSWALVFERLAQRVEQRGRACLQDGRRGQRPRPSAAGLDVLPDRRVLRRRGHQQLAPDGGAQSGLLRFGGHPAPTAGGGGRDPLRGRFAAGLPGPPGPRIPPGRPGPTLVGVGGFDSSAEELYFHLGAPGAERGWTVFVFDGPGQPGCMRNHPGMTFRPDYEVPIGAVIDHLVERRPTSTPTGWRWPVRASARTSRLAARPPTPGSAPWWSTRRSWT